MGGIDYFSLWRERYVCEVFSADALRQKDGECFDFFERSGLLEKIFPPVIEKFSHVLFEKDEISVEGFVHDDRWVRALLLWEGKQFSHLEIKGFVLSCGYESGALREWYARVSPEERGVVLESWNAYVHAPTKRHRVGGVSRRNVLKLGSLGTRCGIGAFIKKNLVISFDGEV